MYLRERDFDAVIEKAQNKFAIAGRGGVALIKAIIAVESEFEPRKKTLSGKYGLMGLTLDCAKSISTAVLQSPATEGDLLDAAVNIQIGAALLRYFYNALQNPDTFDVIAAYGRAVASTDANYVDRVWAAFMHYSQLSNEPYSSYPHEAAGVELRQGSFSRDWMKE
jgi:soluble lytic murein transglycosylase-like protein